MNVKSIVRIVLTSMTCLSLLAACGPVATPTVEQQPTQAVQATNPPEPTQAQPTATLPSLRATSGS